MTKSDITLPIPEMEPGLLDEVTDLRQRAVALGAELDALAARAFVVGSIVEESILAGVHKIVGHVEEIAPDSESIESGLGTYFRAVTGLSGMQTEFRHLAASADWAGGEPHTEENYVPGWVRQAAAELEGRFDHRPTWWGGLEKALELLGAESA